MIIILWKHFKNAAVLQTLRAVVLHSLYYHGIRLEISNAPLKSSVFKLHGNVMLLADMFVSTNICSAIGLQRSCAIFISTQLQHA